MTDPGWTRGLGQVHEGPPPFTSVVAPDTVTRGAPFQVTLSTFGSGSCTLADGYVRTALPMSVEVRLYDLTASGNVACTDDLASFPRTMTLQFDQTGTAEVVAVGRGFDGQVRQVRKAITVQAE